MNELLINIAHMHLIILPPNELSCMIFLTCICVYDAAMNCSNQLIILWTAIHGHHVYKEIWTVSGYARPHAYIHQK